MFSRKQIIVGLIVAGMSGGWYYWYSSSNSAPMMPTTRMVKVETGSLSSTIKATGNISAMEESTLSFAKDGIVSAIYKKEGDTVKSWDIIAEIDAGTALLDLESAERNLSDAQASYDELYTSITASDTSRAKATLEESEASIKVLEADYENLLVSQKNTLTESDENLKLLESKVELAKSEYEYAKKDLAPDDETDNLMRDIENAWSLIDQTPLLFTSQLDTVENITGIDEKIGDYYYDLSMNDMDLKSKTDYSYYLLTQKLSAYESGVLDIKESKTQSNFTTVYKALEDSKIMITEMSSFLDLVLRELDATPAGNPWSSDVIQSARDSIGTLKWTLSSKKDAINASLISLKEYGSDDLQALSDKNTLTAKEQSLVTAENSLAKAKREYELLQKEQASKKFSAQNEIIRQKNTIVQNQYTYNDLLAWPESSEIRQKKSQIESARIALEKAQENMKDYQVIASFDGTVEDIPWTIGETAEMTEGILIANKDTYKIELSLDQIDIVKVKEWMDATIVLDAYEDKTFTGNVISISATPTITSGVVSYTATIWLKITGVNVMSSMSATVNILVQNKENIILLPSAAISGSGGESYVNVIVSGMWPNAQTEKRSVEIGTISDGKTEIISGLTVGESVSYTPVSVTTSSTSSTSSTRSNNASMGGGMGGPPGGF